MSQSLPWRYLTNMQAARSTVTLRSTECQALRSDSTSRGDSHRDDRRQGVELSDDVISRHPSDPRREGASKQRPWVCIRIAIAKCRLQEIREHFRHWLTSTSVAKESRRVGEDKEPAGEPMVRRRPSRASWSSELRAGRGPSADRTRTSRAC